jgi:uncharacterized HAD superfamily protein
MSERRAIGLDFDDTLMPTREAIVDILNSLHATNFRVEECAEFFLSQRWNLDRRQFIEFFTANQGRIHGRAPLAGVMETLREWSPKADFYVITGRPDCWRSSMIQWLGRHGIPFAQAQCAETGEAKAHWAVAQRFSFFIEDRADFATAIAQAGIPTFLLNRPYNQQPDPPLIHRVNDWHDIRQVVARERFLQSPAAEHCARMQS